MSFFGFDTTLPKDRNFFSQQDAFAGLSSNKAAGDEEEILDFEDTYDGLGNRLDESQDAFNDDTFGGGGPQTKVGKDFDFFGNTAQYADTMQEEEALHNARQAAQPKPVASKPKQAPASAFLHQQAPRNARSGYENYSKPEYIPQLEASASIWGLPAKKSTEPKPQQQPQPPPLSSSLSQRKMMSLEEVEAAMRSQSRQPSGAQNLPPYPQQAPPLHQQQQQQQQQYQLPHDQMQFMQPPPGMSFPPGMQILQRPQHQDQGMPAAGQRQSPFVPDQRTPPQPIPGMQQPQHQQPQHQHQQSMPVQIPTGPRQQQQQQQQPQMPQQLPQGGPVGGDHARGPSHGGPPVTQAQQMMQMTDEQRAIFLAEEAKRAKRNHKIFLLSKSNGLMTPQDKNFITRIQLQQLLTATGGVNDQIADAQLAEDFYYQVYAQIRGAPRSNPHQPLNQFAQTYLFQTGGRFGGGRRHPRGGDNHIQRMEQQVQRAVEAAKARPKNKQLVVEGSLGKIAFSNSKTPRPLLNFKRADNELRPHSQRHSHIADRKATLRNIENVYATLMQMEDHERHLPPPPREDSHPDEIQRHIEWRTHAQELNQKLWSNLKVMEPIQQDPNIPHPFIAILSHSKGKKAIPRIFRHIDDQQRLTIITLLSVHLDSLDVIRLAYPHPDEPVLPRTVRDEVELFAQAVIPTLLAYINDAPLSIISGLLGLIIERVNVQAIMRTKIGVSFLTILVSRAVLIKQVSAGQNIPEDDWTNWNQLYNRLFDLAEPVLPYIFTTENVAQSSDYQVWQFLATMGVSASPEQQQRLVLGVKERVMQTVEISKQLPPDMAGAKLGEVNLFMRAIGLDVELLG